MATTLKLAFFFVLTLTSSGNWWFTEVGQAEAAWAWTRRHVDCSNNKYCDPFGKKIDWKCKNASVCQEKCNSFGGVFTCTDHPGYCLCQTQT